MCMTFMLEIHLCYILKNLSIFNMTNGTDDDMVDNRNNLIFIYGKRKSD